MKPPWSRVAPCTLRDVIALGRYARFAPRFSRAPAHGTTWARKAKEQRGTISAAHFANIFSVAYEGCFRLDPQNLGRARALLPRPFGVIFEAETVISAAHGL